MTYCQTILLACLVMTAASALTASPSSSPALSTIFDNVAAVLRERYYNKKFREEQLPALIRKYRPAPEAGADLKAQRAAAEKLLAHIPASHLGLFSEESFRYLIAELGGQPQPSFGFQLVRIADEFFTSFVLEAG